MKSSSQLTSSFIISGCSEALGMENYKIPDSSIQASSRLDQRTKASNGRLHNFPTVDSDAAWSAGVANTHQWFQVDFGNLTAVSVIATQGRQNVDQWIKEYRVSYSYDGLLYGAYRETSANDVKVFVTQTILICNTNQQETY